MEQKPSIGRIVVYHQQNEDHPAIITHVWSDDCVNLKVFFDCGPIEDLISCHLSTGYWSWPERV